MLNWIELASSPTADTPGTFVALRGERRSYIFGRMTEGMQRALTQRRLSLVNFGNFFVSGVVGCETVGGLLGSLLTTTDAIAMQKVSMDGAAKGRTGKAKDKVSVKVLDRIDVHGGPNLNYWLATGRHFVFRYGIPLSAIETKDDPRRDTPTDVKPDWEDDSIMVWKIPVRRRSSSRRPSSPVGGATTTASPPRKRTHGEAMAEDQNRDQNRNREDESSAGKRQADFEAVEAVVSHMFGTTWNRDMVVETRLGDVEMPSTVFIKDGKSTIRKYTGPMPGEEGFDPDTTVWMREPWPAAKVTNLPHTEPSTTSLCYVVHHQERRGRFKVELAAGLGVPKKSYGKLCAGSAIELDNGTTVTPDMVLEPPIKGHGFAVIDIPDPDYVPAFLARAEWSNVAVMETVGLMFWQLGVGVVRLPEIQKFMQDRPGIRHIVASLDTCPNTLSLESAAMSVVRCHAIDPDRFPLLRFNSQVTSSSSESIGVSSQIPEDALPYERVQVGRKIRVMPQWLVQDDNLVPFPDLVSAATDLPEQVVALSTEARSKVSDPAFLARVEEAERDMPGRDVEITTLGTGSSQPSKYRNVSATLLRVPGVGNYLLDCGEGTLGQLRRGFGWDGAVDVLRELRCIVISHAHADHHLGSASVIRGWAAAAAAASNPQAANKLTIVCADNMRRFYEEYARLEDISIDRLEFLTAAHGHYAHPTIGGASITRLPADQHPSRLSAVVRVQVHHCKFAYATILEWPSGLRIAYSGDCRPSDNFAAAARGCTLLVHEATLDDSLQADAEAKRHCTMSEALAVARKMCARRVLLTHFSQRFSKEPNMEQQPDLSGEDREEGEGEGKDKDEGGGKAAQKADSQVVLMAFDMMRVKLGEFRHAAQFVPAIMHMYEQAIAADGKGDADTDADANADD